jgi:hypothetical protein
MTSIEHPRALQQKISVETLASTLGMSRRFF